MTSAERVQLIDELRHLQTLWPGLNIVINWEELLEEDAQNRANAIQRMLATD
ncbi:unnamed protein product, partial [marine sediment metagenome]